MRRRATGRYSPLSWVIRPRPADPTAGALAEFLREVDLSFDAGLGRGRLDDRLLGALSHNTNGRRLLSFFDYGGFFAADALPVWLARKLDEGTTGRRAAAPLRLDDAGRDAPGDGGGAVADRFGRDPRAAAHPELLHRARCAGGVGGADVDERAAAVAGGGVARGVGRLLRPRPGRVGGGFAGRGGDGGRGVTVEFPHRTAGLAGGAGAGHHRGRTRPRVLGFLIDERLPVAGAPSAPDRASGAGAGTSWGRCARCGGWRRWWTR